MQEFMKGKKIRRLKIKEISFFILLTFFEYYHTDSRKRSLSKYLIFFRKR